MAGRPWRSGTRLGSGRVLRIFGFSDGEVQNPFGLFYTSDRVRVSMVRVILDITEMCNK